MDGGDLLVDLPQQHGRRRKPGRTPKSATSRPQPIRNAIMAFLDQPRTVKEIAGRIERRTCVATGHLRAMRARNLVVRLSWGVWVRRDRCTDAPAPDTIQRSLPAQDRLLRHLEAPRTVSQLERITGRSQSQLRALLAKMEHRAVVERRPERKFAKISVQPHK